MIKIRVRRKIRLKMENILNFLTLKRFLKGVNTIKIEPNKLLIKKLG